VISCWSCSQSSYLFDLADALSVPGGGYILKEDPRRWLEPCITRNTSRRSEPESLPSDDEIEAWQRRLKEEDKVMRYLRRDRGLTPTIIKAARLGYDGRAITIPIYDIRTRELCNFRRRFWPNVPASGYKYLGLEGRTIDNGGVTLYPALPDGSVILCAGEFDALALWSQGLPGMTVTSGAATRWQAKWNGIVKGRRVAVMFDADPREEDQAISRAAELRQAGADAWPVLLTRAGLSPGEDITDFFVKHGRSSRELLRLINSERQRYSRRGRRAA
jgi:DNA primase